MRAPATSAPVFLYMNPAERYVQLNSFAFPTLQVLSLQNLVSATPIIQNTGTAQPVWSKTAIGGQYYSTIFPGSTSTTGLIFSGTQSLSYDSLGTVFSGGETPLSVVMQVACGSSGGTLFSIASSSATTPRITLSYSAGTLTLTEVNSNGSFSTSTTVDTNLHVVSAVRTNNTLSLRVDNAAVGSPATITAGTETFNTCTIGALNNNGSVSSQFNGTIGKMIVLGGSAADIYPTEIEFLMTAGLLRSPSSGINTF